MTRLVSSRQRRLRRHSSLPSGRYHGVLAAASTWRPLIVPASVVPDSADSAGQAHSNCPEHKQASELPSDSQKKRKKSVCRPGNYSWAGRSTSERTSILLRIEGFNLFNHGNYLGRGQTTFGDTGTPNTTFGQVASVSGTGALPAFANVDPPRMFQLQVRFQF